MWSTGGEWGLAFVLLARLLRVAYLHIIYTDAKTKTKTKTKTKSNMSRTDAIYKWEKNSGRIWDDLREDAEGELLTSGAHNKEIDEERKRSHRAKQNRVTQSIR